MLKHELIENTLIAVAQRQGVDLDNKDLLDIRTKVAATLAAKERYRQLTSGRSQRPADSHQRRHHFPPSKQWFMWFQPISDFSSFQVAVVSSSTMFANKPIYGLT